MRSGHSETVAAVTSPAVIMAILARTSLRADRNAARGRLPLWVRKRTRRQAQHRFTTSAPHPARDRGMGAGGTGIESFSQAVHSVAKPGARRIAARAMPTSERRYALHPSATRMRLLTAAS